MTRLLSRCLPRRQRGVSLVEVAFAAAVLGACAVLLWDVSEHQVHVEKEARAASIVARAHDALLAFAHLNGRLPCPAPSTQGLESCKSGGSGSGFLPYITLGLPTPEAGRVRYEVSTGAPSLTAVGAADAVVVGRAEGEHGDLVARNVPLATLAAAQQKPLYDLCASLGGSAHGALAYGLAAEAGNGATTTTTTTSADGGVEGGAGGTGAKTGGAREERVQVGRAALAARLGCAPLSAAARAHFNAALGGRIMARAMRDYRDQFDMGYHTYAADLAQGVFFATNATYGTMRAYTKMLVAKAEMESTAGAHMEPYVTSLASLASSGIYTGALSSNVARFATNIEKAQTRRETIHALSASTDATAADIERRAVLGVTRASFGETSP